METLIECKSLSAGYEGVTVINDLSFTVNSGDFLSIAGENCSGKTTLMKTLLGLKEPQSGSIIFGGGLKASEIGYLPQQTALQKDFPATVKEVVLSGRLSKRGLRPFYGKEDKQKANECMELMDIIPLKSRSYRELSGGQQQRVLLARALCATEKLLLLDEPVSGLDPTATQDMYDTIHRLNSERGVTVIMITHDLNGALRYSKQILHMEAGQYFFGSTEEYRASDIFHTMSTCDCHCCCNHHLKGGGADA